ncbi:MAG: hypothetical protein BYD32DRAFT_201529 [Podila humilis]|nr:MAG: hypothetical protein BYD32DRAFT_201529 [Podila humilis]
MIDQHEINIFLSTLMYIGLLLQPRTSDRHRLRRHPHHLPCHVLRPPQKGPTGTAATGGHPSHRARKRPARRQQHVCLPVPAAARFAHGSHLIALRSCRTAIRSSRTTILVPTLEHLCSTTTATIKCLFSVSTHACFTTDHEARSPTKRYLQLSAVHSASRRISGFANRIWADAGSDHGPGRCALGASTSLHTRQVKIRTNPQK